MNSMDELWNGILEYIKSKINETVYKVWFEDIKMLDFNNGTAQIVFQSNFKKKTVHHEYDSLLHEAFKAVIGFDCEIEYLSVDEISAPQNVLTSFDLEDFRNSTFTFENFISGPSNKFAYTAAKAVAGNPGGILNNSENITDYNPLFIYGASGLGKTHLLNAISHEVSEKYPDLVIKYVSAEKFLNEFIEALESKTVNEFHDRYRNNIDVFLVDDIQFIAGKTQTEEEFFHTFNSLVESGKQVVLTSDRPPKEIHSLTDRLRSRFVSGLLADIQSPEFETRCAIIKRKAQLLNFTIDDSVVEYIADRVKSNIRQLEGITKTLQAKCTFGDQKTPTIAIAKSAIDEIVIDNTPPLPVTIKRVVDEVSRTTGISVEDIYSKKRTASISTARKMTFYIIRNITDMPYTAIGEEFNKDHTTVSYNIEELEKILASNSTLNSQVLDIINNIKNE